MIKQSVDVVYTSSKVTVTIMKKNMHRSFFVLRVTLHKTIQTDTLHIIFDSVEAGLKNTTDTMYIEMDVVACDFISLSNLETISNRLHAMRSLIANKLNATFIKCSDDSYYGRGIYGTLLAFFRSLYTPIKPYDFYCNENDLLRLYTKYEKITSST